MKTRNLVPKIHFKKSSKLTNQGGSKVLTNNKQIIKDLVKPPVFKFDESIIKSFSSTKYWFLLETVNKHPENQYQFFIKEKIGNLDTLYQPQKISKYSFFNTDFIPFYEYFYVFDHICKKLNSPCKSLFTRNIDSCPLAIDQIMKEHTDNIEFYIEQEIKVIKKISQCYYTIFDMKEVDLKTHLSNKRIEANNAANQIIQNSII